jgi:glycosyltransferase involved in cell wall biosynthesis
MDWMPNQEAVKWFIKEVWPSLKTKHPEIKFYIAGRNMPKEFFNFSGNGIDVLGEVDDAIQLMLSKSIMIVPLFSGSGIRVKILEGLALGKCLVSTEMSFTGISVQPDLNLFQAETASDFINQISKLICNPFLIEKTGREARKLVENKYESSMVIKDILSYYRNLNNIK